MHFPHLIQFELFVQRQHRPVFGHTGHQEQEEMCETNGKQKKLISSFRKECPSLLDLPTFSNLSIPFFSISDPKINENGCCWSTNSQANSCRCCSSFCRWRSASCASKVWQPVEKEGTPRGEVSVERKIEAPKKRKEFLSTIRSKWF